MQRKRHPHADAMTEQRRDDRFLQRDADAWNRAQERFGRYHAPGSADFLDVGPGAEGFRPGAGEHGDPHGFVSCDVLPDFSQPLLGRNVECIENVRPVEGDDCDPVRAFLVEDRHLRTCLDNCRRRSTNSAR